MSAGNAYVMGHSVLNDINGVRENLGYCPQFDALDNLLTAREHIYFYARLRGIKQQNICYIADSLLKRLGLTLWADRPVRQYSGGNKRKLSTAISLIGNPSIIFMDEPTTGMDVRAKRFLWNCILTLTRKERKSVVITSHRFGNGYTIVLRANVAANIDTLTQYITARLSETTLRESHKTIIHFNVPITVKLYEMFSVLEQARADLLNTIEDYTVTQVTLDDVFVNFAKSKEESDSINGSQSNSSATSTTTNVTADLIQDQQNMNDKTTIHDILTKLIYRKKVNHVEMTKL
ncbi:unnamed protein product [Didymodactylos carnosus]|uniref:ABC transporter domain-containing protein n=1 Tax=Didymodactylos carnosus TaxID=1234261 RepID=A0A8S2MA74_9BILA|nr:unnamed protein product [Didymodactylos carnosus]CAF4152342.1 unnamed protein product [Didymodactylos carnosus]